MLVFRSIFLVYGFFIVADTISDIYNWIYAKKVDIWTYIKKTFALNPKIRGVTSRVVISWLVLFKNSETC